MNHIYENSFKSFNPHRIREVMDILKISFILTLRVDKYKPHRFR